MIRSGAEWCIVGRVLSVTVERRGWLWTQTLALRGSRAWWGGRNCNRHIRGAHVALETLEEHDIRGRRRERRRHLRRPRSGTAGRPAVEKYSIDTDDDDVRHFEQFQQFISSCDDGVAAVTCAPSNSLAHYLAWSAASTFSEVHSDLHSTRGRCVSHFHPLLMP